MRPDYVVGTSIGAVNGAMIAAGASPAALRVAWLKPPGQILRRRRDWWRVLRWRGLLDSAPLRRFIEATVDLHALRASPVEYQMTAVDIVTGERLVWDKSELTIDHFMATMALPPAFEPVDVDGRQCVDGGVLSNLPLWEAVAAGCDTIYALLHDPLEWHSGKPPRRLRDVVWRVSDIAWHSRVEKDLLLLRERVGLARDLSRRFRFIPIGPDPPLQNDMLRSDPRQAELMYEAGQKRAAAVLGTTKEAISLQHTPAL